MMVPKRRVEKGEGVTTNIVEMIYIHLRVCVWLLLLKDLEGSFAPGLVTVVILAACFSLTLLILNLKSNAREPGTFPFYPTRIMRDSQAKG